MLTQYDEEYISRRFYGRLQANYMRSFNQHNLNVTAVAGVEQYTTR